MDPLFDKSQKEIRRTSLDDSRILSGSYWAELRTFLAVAKAKSYNKAGAVLNMSRQTISRDIQRLQDQMGAILLVPANNGITLTERGKELAARLMPVDELLFSMSNEVRAETREAEGLVRITATEALTGFFVIPGLVPFGQRYPKIHTQLQSPLNLLNFRDNACDVMVGFGELPDADIESRPAGTLHLIGVAAQSYVDERGVPTWENLGDHRFVDADYYASKTPTYASWRNAVARGTAAHHCNNPYNYALMVKAGFGIGLLGNFILIDRDFVPVGSGIHVKLPIFIHAQTERLRSRPVRLVFNQLAEIFNPKNSWFGADLTLDGFPRAVSQSLNHIAGGTHHRRG